MSLRASATMRLIFWRESAAARFTSAAGNALAVVFFDCYGMRSNLAGQSMKHYALGSVRSPGGGYAQRGRVATEAVAGDSHTP